MNTRLMAALIVGSFVLAGCGGGGGGTTGMTDAGGSPLPYTGLSGGQIVSPGTYHVVDAAAGFLQALDEIEQPPGGYAPGSTLDIAALGMRCAGDSATNCSVTVHDDDSFTTTGTIVTVMTGGTFPMTPGEQLAAEMARADEEKARADAEEAARLAAEAAAQAAEAARVAAEAALAEAAAEVRQADAGRAIVGLRSTTPVGGVAVTPRHAALAGVTATPTGGSAVNFASKTLSSASGWSVTTLSNPGFTHNDDLVAYSNRGAPTRILLTEEYDQRFMDNDQSTANTPMSDDIGNPDGRLIRSGSFPTVDGDDKSYSNNYEDDDPPDTSDGPDIVRLSGSFHHAQGYFHCTASDQTACTIGKRGDRYTIESGSWTFHTTDTARALVDDKSYVHFGWWKREQKSDEAQTFQSFRGGVSGDHVATTNPTYSPGGEFID